MQSPSATSAHATKPDCALVIMAKAPRPGQVKTRLAESLSFPLSDVTDFYGCLLQDTITLAQSLGTVDVAIMCPAADVDELSRDKIMGDAVRIVAQQGEGLAAGLTSVFSHFTAAGYQRVVAFNSDTPHLPASILQSAYDALSGYELVVGPTHDGGYYLVGAKASYPELFNGDGMGTETALNILTARARAMNLSVHLTDPFYDIDVASDLSRLAAELRADPGRAPRTAAWLAEFGQAIPESRSGIGVP
jgi:rSAM/selenodomain-associated transferase 1